MEKNVTSVGIQEITSHMMNTQLMCEEEGIVYNPKEAFKKAVSNELEGQRVRNALAALAGGNETVDLNEKFDEVYLTVNRKQFEKFDLVFLRDIAKEFYENNELHWIETMDDVNRLIKKDVHREFINNAESMLRLRVSISLRVFSHIANYLRLELVDSASSEIVFKLIPNKDETDFAIEFSAYNPKIARAFTDYKRVCIDLEFFANSSVKQIHAIYLHELCHPFFMHNTRVEESGAYLEIRKAKDELKVLESEINSLFRDIPDEELNEEDKNNLTPRMIDLTNKLNQANRLSKRVKFLHYVSNSAMDIPINEFIEGIEENKELAKKFSLTSYSTHENNFDYTGGIEDFNSSFESFKKSKSRSDLEVNREKYFGGYVNFNSMRNLFLSPKRQKGAVDLLDLEITRESTSEEIFIKIMNLYDSKKDDDSFFNFMDSLIGAANYDHTDRVEIDVERKEDFELVIEKTAATMEHEGIPNAGSRSSIFAKLLGELTNEKSSVDWRSRIAAEVSRLYPVNLTYKRLQIAKFALGTIAPTSEGTFAELIVMTDTSASMMNPLNDAIVELENILDQFDNYKITYYAVDTDVCGSVEFDIDNPFTRESVIENTKGNGGTDFTTFFQKMIDEGNTVPVIVITDMGFWRINVNHDAVNFPVFWLAVDGSYKHYEEKDLPFGEMLEFKRYK